jgi:hypothetical protein
MPAPLGTFDNIDTHGGTTVAGGGAEHTGTWVDHQCPIKVFTVKQRTNDINANGDGPTWIQTATGADKARTAGGTPTTDCSHTARATAAKQGR